MKKCVSLAALAVAVVFFWTPFYGNAAPRAIIVAESVLGHTNAERYREGLPFLMSNPLLSQIAREKMYDMFAYQYFAHESPNGVTVGDQAKKVGYEYILVGENLALGDFDSSKHVVDAWMDSPGHRKNILSPTYSEIGIAAGRGVYEGRSTWVVVQSFGLPKATCPPLDEVFTEKIADLERKIEILQAIAEVREKEMLRRDGSNEEKRVRVESYNTVARLYNFYVGEHRELIDTHNESITKYNDCIKDIKRMLDDIED